LYVVIFHKYALHIKPLDMHTAGYYRFYPVQRRKCVFHSETKPFLMQGLRPREIHTHTLSLSRSVCSEIISISDLVLQQTLQMTQFGETPADRSGTEAAGGFRSTGTFPLRYTHSNITSTEIPATLLGKFTFNKHAFDFIIIIQVYANYLLEMESEVMRIELWETVFCAVFCGTLYCAKSILVTVLHFTVNYS